MGKIPIKHTLAGYIIKKTDTEGYRSGKLTGEKHLNKITEMMEFVGGRRKLIDQARFIENNTQAGHDGKIRISWIQVNSDIKKIDCDVSSIPELCRLEGVEDSRAKQLRLIESVKQWKSEVGDCDWICRYYDDILGRLEAGKSVTEAEEDMRFKCINTITRIKEPVWERVFSAKVFNDFISKTPELIENYNIINISGDSSLNTLERHLYRVDYVTDLYQPLMDTADLVVTRGGSNTIFELLAMKKLHLIIPLGKEASRGDQLENAAYFERKGYARQLQETELSWETLNHELEQLVEHAETYKEAMAKSEEITSPDDFYNLLVTSISKK